MKPIARVAVMGAGVMGAQLAAHLINQDVPVFLYDLPEPEGRNRRAEQAISRLMEMKPAPLADRSRAALIRTCNTEDDLAQLESCDLVIEAIGERLDWKESLFQLMLPHLKPEAWLVSNTSGLSLTAMGETLPPARRGRFCGLHFFNPPRYMTLVELIRTPWTDEQALPALASFVTSRLGKNIVSALDTPNFVANRIGVAATVLAFHHAQRLGLSCAVVDDLTGPRLGRPRSATYRTADVVGLDILAHVIETNHSQATQDPFHRYFAPDPVIQQLLSLGALGAKSGQGFYRKDGQTILQWDSSTAQYKPIGDRAHVDVCRCLDAPPQERLARLRQLDHPEAEFLWAIHRDLFHYCALHLATVSPSAREMDLALRWGFGWALGPLETWQLSGWQAVAQWIEEDRRQQRTLIDLPLPDWALDPTRCGVHGTLGSWSAQQGQEVQAPATSWSQRQYFPVALLGSSSITPKHAGKTLRESAAARLWTMDDEILIFTLRTKMNILSESALAALDEALTLASQDYRALVLWGPGPHFSAGGDLAGFIDTYVKRGMNGLSQSQARFQQVVQRLRHCPIPTVAALQGYVLGGGCEIALHCDRRVAHTESYLGLVEVNVGLFPGAGGVSEMARRAGQRAQAAGTPLLVADYVKEDVTHMMRSEVSGSAQEARQWGWLDEGDVIVPHAEELLHVALSQAKALMETAYVAPLETLFPIAGTEGRAQLLGALTNAHQGGLLSDHDLLIGRTLATVVSGGPLPAGTLVPVTYLLALEREHFGPLLATAKSQERIQTLLESGKAVRN